MQDDGWVGGGQTGARSREPQKTQRSQNGLIGASTSFCAFCVLCGYSLALADTCSADSERTSGTQYLERRSVRKLDHLDQLREGIDNVFEASSPGVDPLPPLAILPVLGIGSSRKPQGPLQVAGGASSEQ